MAGREVNPVTWSREVLVFATSSEAAVTVAKDAARAAGLRVVTVAKVHAVDDRVWSVRLAVRQQEAMEGV